MNDSQKPSSRIAQIASARYTNAQDETRHSATDVYMPGGSNSADPRAIIDYLDEQYALDSVDESNRKLVERSRSAKFVATSPEIDGMVSRYLTREEKAAHLEEWNICCNADEGVRPLMEKLNAIEDVCTVQSCVGHTEKMPGGSIYVKSAHVEMRLGPNAMRRFFDAMPIIGTHGFVEDAMLSMRPGYLVASVWGLPGSLPEIVDELVLTFRGRA